MIQLVNKIYRFFWAVFLAVVYLFIVRTGQDDAPINSFRAFMDLSSYNGVVHFDSSEAEKGLLTFQCKLPDVHIEQAFLAVSDRLPVQVDLGTEPVPIEEDCETIDIGSKIWYLIPLGNSHQAKELAVRFNSDFLDFNSENIPSGEYGMYQVPRICFGSRNALLNNLAMSSNLHLVASAVLFFVAIVILFVSAVFQYIYKIKTYAFNIGFCFLGFCVWILCESALAMSVINGYSIDVIKCIAIFIIPVLLFRYITLEFPTIYPGAFSFLCLMHFMILIFSVCSIALGFFSFYQLEQSLWFFFTCSLMVSICYLSAEASENRGLHTVCISIVIMFFTFFIYLLFYNFQPIVSTRSLAVGSALLILYNFTVFLPATVDIYRQSLERKNLEQQLNEQVKHYRIVEAKEQQYRKLRHDMKSHWQVIQVLLSSGKVEDALNYTSGIQEELEFHTPHQIINTGNAFVDAVLTSKLEQAVGLGIHVDTEIMVIKNMKIDMIDCSIIFGNLLDNAIEACMRQARPEDRRILVKLLYKKGMLVCAFCNSMDPSVHLDSRFLSSKPNPDNHGIGLANIKEAISKYGGTLNIKTADSRFEASFVLFGV